MADRPPLALLLLALVVVSFPLHLAWEWAQCRPFFIHGAVPVTVPSMVISTLGDLVLTLLAYAGLAAIFGPRWPPHPWSLKVWIALSVLALLLSISMEVWETREQWEFATPWPEY